LCHEFTGRAGDDFARDLVLFCELVYDALGGELHVGGGGDGNGIGGRV